MKVEITALTFVFLQHFAIADDTRCPEYNPQNHLDVELISGLWYGAELITHYEGRGQFDSFDSCIIIEIQEIFEWGDYNYDYDYNTRHVDQNGKHFRFIKLQMNEGDKSAEYTLKFNSTRRGLWIGTKPPRGSVYNKHLYHSHFTGTIQVMKAVATHLVLTFCERSELFTVILTRSKRIAVDDIESIHNLLQRRGINVQSTRELCRYFSAAERPTLPFKILLSMIALGILLIRN